MFEALKKKLGLLVLSRKKNESVVCTVPPSETETVINVHVVEIRGDKTRLGFNAPTTVAVHRREVYDAIKLKGGSVFQRMPESPASEPAT